MDNFDFNKAARSAAIANVIITLVWGAVIIGGLYLLISAFA